MTANSVDMGPGLPSVTFDQLQKLAADPKATAEFYKPWTKTVPASPTLRHAADRGRVRVRRSTLRSGTLEPSAPREAS